MHYLVLYVPLMIFQIFIKMSLLCGLFFNGARLRMSHIYSEINELAGSSMSHQHEGPTLLLPIRDTVIWSPRKRVGARLESCLSTDADLERFCLLYFPEIQREFSSGMSRKQKINQLLECIEPYELEQKLSQSVAEQQSLPVRQSLQPPKRAQRANRRKSRVNLRDMLLGGLLFEQLRRFVEGSRELLVAVAGWFSTALTALGKLVLGTSSVAGVVGAVSIVGAVGVGVATHTIRSREAERRPAAVKRSRVPRARVPNEAGKPPEGLPADSRSATEPYEPLPTPPAETRTAPASAAQAPSLLPAPSAAAALDPRNRTAPSEKAKGTGDGQKSKSRKPPFSSVPLLPDLDRSGHAADSRAQLGEPSPAGARAP